ncbi:hypothetical protein QR680_019339 [Steinernema hermaphroditum]|uniref:Uncharacterized protein n=1 Tax=Steinernema hermaphroditum TaxID=289476 RepID=A0AA39LAT4_9BILA|nr:hypothetical protein QR680_019339 [Steinernema hermaphroditum]
MAPSKSKCSDSLYHKHGAKAVGSMIDYMKQFPDLCRVDMLEMESTDELTEELQEQFGNVLKKMNEEYGDVSERSIFIAWKSLRFRFLTYGEPKKWHSHLTFLYDLEPAAEDYGKRPKPISDASDDEAPSKRPRLSTEPSKEAASDNAPNLFARMEKLRESFGQEAVRSLIEEVGKHSEFWEVHIGTRDLCELPRSSRNVWTKIMEALLYRFPAMTSEITYEAWRVLRNNYGTKTCPPQYAGKVPYLDAHIADTRDKNDASSQQRGTNQRLSRMDYFSNTYGTEATEELIRIIGTDKSFYSKNMRLNKVEDMKEEDQNRWEIIMNELKHNHPNVTQNDALSAWNSVRRDYFNGRCPHNWIGKVSYLNEMKAQVTRKKRTAPVQPDRVSPSRSETVSSSDDVIIPVLSPSSYIDLQEDDVLQDPEVSEGDRDREESPEVVFVRGPSFRNNDPVQAINAEQAPTYPSRYGAYIPNYHNYNTQYFYHPQNYCWYNSLSASYLAPAPLADTSTAFQRLLKEIHDKMKTKDLKNKEENLHRLRKAVLTIVNNLHEEEDNRPAQ